MIDTIYDYLFKIKIVSVNVDSLNHRLQRKRRPLYLFIQYDLIMVSLRKYPESKTSFTCTPFKSAHLFLPNEAPVRTVWELLDSCFLVDSQMAFINLWVWYCNGTFPSWTNVKWKLEEKTSFLAEIKVELDRLWSVLDRPKPGKQDRSCLFKDSTLTYEVSL